MRSLHCDLHVECVSACRSEAVRNGCRPWLHEMHGLRERLSKRRPLFRFRETDNPRSKIGGDPQKLFLNVAGGNHLRARVSRKFSGCSRRLCVGPFPDGARLRRSYHVSRSENVAVASRKRIVLLPFQLEVCRHNSKGGLVLCDLCLRLDWIERAQRLGALS